MTEERLKTKPSLLALMRTKAIIIPLLKGVHSPISAPKSVIPVQDMIKVQYQWPKRLPKAMSKQAPNTNPTFGGSVRSNSVLREVVASR